MLSEPELSVPLPRSRKASQDLGYPSFILEKRELPKNCRYPEKQMSGSGFGVV
jgi:hypothetical protein